ncbi:FtsW/RodA/SpoVE family cell cycle protein [Flavobacterium agricola]|uniref:FtsW/RodA/SpoVE family cell cycle protein n=1 Tax=Flavobacterium agricola TaxID=2870839 RepID=UPI002222F56C|nr:FtsW/RodA/SpoVE family cell cycle protein [Flavobacterium agricola]
MHVSIGLFFVYLASKVKYQKLTYIIYFLLPCVFILLVVTALGNNVIAGANASRWIKVPFINVTFQPSAMAFVILNMYIAHYLAKKADSKTPFDFKRSLLLLWLPIAAFVAVIIPANLSTGVLLLATNILLIFLGGYPIKYLLNVAGITAVLVILLVALATIFPDKLPSRFSTWKARIERFTADDEKQVDNYQTENANIAIATGKVFGLGPGKSVQRNFLPQSSSDFIFAIIVEEYGLFGAFLLIFVYLSLFFRFIINSIKVTDSFGRLLIYGLGFPIIIQAFVNMGVAVQLFPTTGQPLPLISSGGTSIWITCASIGVILSVTAQLSPKKEVEKTIKKPEKNEAEFNPTDEQVAEAFSVVEKNA